MLIVFGHLTERFAYFNGFSAYFFCTKAWTATLVSTRMRTTQPTAISTVRPILVAVSVIANDIK